VPVVTLAANEGPLTELASVVIPVAHQAESEGTFVNRKGMEQRFLAAIRPAPGVRPGWQTLGMLGDALGKPFKLSQLSDVRRGIESVRPPGASVKPEARV
jgi:NADH-quinone oxidoreductase subunit G